MADTIPLPAAAKLIGRPAQPGPADKVASRLIQLGLQRNPPGQWADNKYRQLEHFTGLVSMAIRPYLNAISGARFTALQRKTTVRKSVAGAGNFSRDEEYEPIDPDHPLAHILEHPGGEDGDWSMQQECSYLMLQKLLTGDAPAWTPVNEDGKPCQFFALTGSSVQANTGMGLSEQYPNGSYRVLQAAGNTMWFAGLGATSAIIPAEQLRFFRDPHPLWRNSGMGRTQCGALEIDVLEAITRSRWSFFDRGAQLGVAIYVPGADEATAQRIQEDFQQKHAGARNAYNVLVIGGAGGFDPQGKPLTVQQLSQSARELDFQSSYEQAGAVVAALFGVPKVMMGLSESGSSYAADWAAQQRFYDLGLMPQIRDLSAFLTKHLAGPWCESPKQYVIEVEVDPPQNVEAAESELQFALQQGVIYVNDYNAAHNRRPVEGGDAPLPVYTAQLQQAAQPQMPPGAPGGDPQQPGDQMPPDGQPAPEGAEAGPEDEQGAQDAITQAALESLGLGADTVQKAAGPPRPTKPGGRQVRREGEKWQGPDGQWYTKKNGKRVAIGDPNKQRTAAAQPAPGTGAPAKPAGGQLLDVRAAIKEHGGESDRAFDALRGKISQHLASGGKASFWIDGKQVPVSRVEGGKVYDAQGAPVGMMPLAAGMPGTKSGIELHAPEQQQAAPAPKQQLSPDQQRMYKQFSLAKNPRLREYGKRMLSGDDPHAAAAQSLPQTPAVQQAAQIAPQWAAKAAEKHADAVAKHFGISREQAHRLLTRAIAAVGEHAAQGVTIRDKRTGKTATLTRKAMNTLDDSAGGFLVPPPGTVKRKRRKMRRMVADVLKGL